MPANKVVAGVAAIVVIGALGWGLLKAFEPQVQPLQGQIEAREYNISSKVPGRVEQVMVRKGDSVVADDLLFSIDSPELRAKLQQAQGGRDAAKAMLAEADKGARQQEINASKEQWLKAKAGAELANTTYQRVQNLFDEGVVARQKRDEAYTQWQAAQYTEQAAYSMYEMAQEGAREETKAAAAGNALMAEGALKEVSSILNDSQMRSPIAGEITDVLLQPGELVPQGFPVVSLVDMTDAWAIFQIREDKLSEFTKGAAFKLYIPALKREADFVVSHISVMGDFATWRSTETGNDFDMRTFSVEMRPTAAVADLRVGMSVLLTP
ncbi:HlyD family secretion protein [Paraferrimonas haliotis]|uniref:HlyD family secretion protein n=1 Tax=Paraferrimonas haliotis TaxID=2013866 RepID=UPI000BA8FB3B|nr:biotin/lipoyl-binding protein [Paraferrimonas haliotis]